MSAIAKEVLIKTGNALPIITKSTQPKSLYRALKVMDGNGVGEAVVSSALPLSPNNTVDSLQHTPMLDVRGQGDSALPVHNSKSVRGLVVTLFFGRNAPKGGNCRAGSGVKGAFLVNPHANVLRNASGPFQEHPGTLQKELRRIYHHHRSATASCRCSQSDVTGYSMGSG